MVQNCISYDSNDDCELCEKNYFYNPTNELCENLITNCVDYEGLNQCRQCVDGFGLDSTNNDNRCMPIINQVNDNCEKYHSELYLKYFDGECVTCTPNS